MTHVEQDAGRRWPCVDALYEMFFSDVDKDSDDITKEDIFSFVKDCLSGCSSKNKKHDDKDYIDIRNKVDMLLRIEPHLKSQPSTNRITWFRFGFLAQRRHITLSNNFVKYFGRWRFLLSLTGKSHTVQDLAAEKIRPAKSTIIKNKRFPGYTMDRFFHSADNIQLFSKKVNWQLVQVGTAELCKTEVISKSNKRSVRDIVGANNYKKIEKCVSVAAKDASFPEIRNKIIDGRYQSKVKRDELVTLLLNRFRTSVTQSESTLRRALSCFVLFPNAWQQADE